MQVPALFAPLGRRGHHRLAAGILLGRWQDHLGDLVAVAFVVHEGAGPELGDSEEARPAHEVAVDGTDGPLATRDERRQGQSGKAVSRQEALGGEVAVAVEVALVTQVLRGGQQVLLVFGFLAEPPSLLLGRLVRRGVGDDPVLGLELGEGRPVQPPPPLDGVVEGPGHGVEHVVEPGLAPPHRLGEDGFNSGQDPAGNLVGSPTGTGVG